MVCLMPFLEESTMHRRLYFMLPDVTHCKKLINELQNAGLKESEIHVIAREDIPLEGLHKASALQQTELAHGLGVGAGVGGVAGMLAGLLAVVFPPAGVVLGGGAVILATTLAGASFGTLLSGLIARDIPNHELDHFQDAILNGSILLLLDIATKRIDEITKLIQKTHPEAHIGIVNAKAAVK
jgi:hypothetical protein